MRVEQLGKRRVHWFSLAFHLLFADFPAILKRFSSDSQVELKSLVKDKLPALAGSLMTIGLVLARARSCRRLLRAWSDTGLAQSRECASSLRTAQKSCSLSGNSRYNCFQQILKLLYKS
jgi:hypothetical protein